MVNPERKSRTERIPDYRKFLNPPAEFRAYPFYSVNDKLDPEEVSRHVREFKRAGFGGFYLHSREGLLTEYMGDEWWKVMEAAVETAKSEGITACFYDEDKWPSGYSGGKIPLMNEEFRAHCLACIRKTTPLPAGAELLMEKDSLVYISYVAPLGNPIFNGTCYVDLFNPEMVKEFIHSAYQPYVERFRKDFARYSMEIFTDEPHIHARYFDRNTPNLGTRSWSPWIVPEFKKMWGYDLVKNLDLLFAEKEKWREVRYHYYRTVASLFERSFSRQIGEYCEKNGVTFTGHFLGEESLEKVRDRIGNAMMHYRNMQQPGIDNLGMSIEGKLITMKSVSSVANQYDIPERACEIYGISGQNMSFEDRKWLAGWQTVLGVNHMIPHLTLYSLKGIRKRDYPPTLSHHQPWWPYNKKLEDYVARICYAARIGKFSPQMLVINPLESEFLKSDKEEDFSGGVMFVIQQLQNLHYNYDLGDEQILSEIARVKGSRLLVGAMSYEAVFLPDMMEIRSSTVDLLDKFIKNGGLVFTEGRFPVYLDGKPDPVRLDSLKKKVVSIERTQFGRMLSWKIEPVLEITSDHNEKIWTSLRKVKDGVLIQLTNISHTEPVDFLLETGLLKDNPVLWDPSEGKCYKPFNLGNSLFDLRLAPSSSIWLTSGSLSHSAIVDKPKNESTFYQSWLEIPGKWKGKRLSPNALALDFARYSIDNGLTYSGPEPVIAIFQRLCGQKYSGQLKLQFTFESEIIPSGICLVIEQPEIFSKTAVNSREVRFDKEHFYIDRHFLSAEITPLITKGSNAIDLELIFKPAVAESQIQAERYGTEIETVYLTGDFGVKGLNELVITDTQRNRSTDFPPGPVFQYSSFVITAEKTGFSGNLTGEGYPFYAGSFMLVSEFSMEKDDSLDYFLSFPSVDAQVAVVELNGMILDTMVWAPWKTEIAQALKNGKNELKVTLVSSLRNLLGPYHHKGGELIRVGPGSFDGGGGFPDPSGDKDWYDKRKVSKDLKLWTDQYHSIPFGILELPVITGIPKSLSTKNPFISNL